MVNGIVAVDLNYGIGFQNELPWPKIKEDLNWFKSITTNQIVVMGSNTWRSIGSRMLPNRINCVVSRNNIHGPNFVFLDPLYAITFFKKIYKDREIFIIGGQQIYNSTINFIDRFYITHIDEKYQCDKFFDFDFVKTHFKKEKLINKFDQSDSIPAFKIIEYTK